jgi:conjugation system TraG family ATPase
MNLSYNTIFPYHSIEKSAIVHGNGDITIGFSLFLPEVYTMGVEQYRNIQDSLVNLFKRLPTGTFIHKQDFFYVDKHKSNFGDKDGHTVKWNLRYYNHRPVLRHYSHLYVTFSQKSSIEVSAKDNAFMAMKDYLSNKPANDSLVNFSTAEKFSDTILNGIASIPGFGIKRMDDDGLECSLFDALNLSYNKPSKPNTPKLLQPFQVEKEFVKYGNHFVALLSLVNEAGELVSSKRPKTSPATIYDNGVAFSNSVRLESSMIFPLGLGLPIDHILNVGFEVLDNELVLGKMNSKSRSLAFLTTFKYEPAISQQESIANFNKSVADDHYQTCRFVCNVVLNDQDLDKLNIKINLTETAFANMGGAMAWSENLELANTYWASIPGNLKSNNRSHLAVLEQALCYFSLESQYKFSKEGFLLIDRMGTPLVVDLWDKDLRFIINRNKLVFGPSGSGKSFWINLFVDQSMYQGNYVRMIDIGKSYRKLTELHKGMFYDSADRQKLSFNIFDCPKDKNGYNYKLNSDDEEGADDKINFIYSVIISIWKPKEKVPQETKAILKDMIRCFYTHLNTHKKIHPSLDEFVNYSKVYEKEKMEAKREKFFDFESFRLVLDPFKIGGQYGYLLNSKEKIDTKQERLVVFELEEVAKNEDLFSLVCVLVIEMILDMTRDKRLEGVRKTFIIDEGLDFLKSDMGDFIAYLYRTFRKKDGEIVFAAQDSQFLKVASDEIRNSITMNTDIKILLDHSNHKSKYKDLKEDVGLTDADIELLDSIENSTSYREFFIKMNSRATIYRNEVSAETGAAYTSVGLENKKIYELFNKTGSMPQAIEQYVENKLSQS